MAACFVKVNIESARKTEAGMFCSLITKATSFWYMDGMEYCCLVLIAQLSPTLCDYMGCSLLGSSVHGILQAGDTGVACHFFFQGIFLIQGSNPGLLHCRQILLLSEPLGRHTVEYCSATKKNKIMPFAGTQMQLDIIILSEVSQRKTNTIWYHLHVESKIWHKCTYLQNRNRPTDVEIRRVVAKVVG